MKTWYYATYLQETISLNFLLCMITFTQKTKMCHFFSTTLPQCTLTKLLATLCPNISYGTSYKLHFIFFLKGHLCRTLIFSVKLTIAGVIHMQLKPFSLTRHVTHQLVKVTYKDKLFLTFFFNDVILLSHHYWELSNDTWKFHALVRS